MNEQNSLFNSKKYYEARNKYDRSRLGRMPLKSRKRLFPILKSIITICNRFNGYKISCIGNKSVDCKMPKIYAITHIGKLDIETVVTYIKEHFVLLSGDFENIYRSAEGTFLLINACIFVRKDDAEDRHLSKEKIIGTLRAGGNIMWFPEGVWNLSPNLPVLSMPYGIIDAAAKENAVIIPIAIEQYDKEFIDNIGANFYVDNGPNLIDEIVRLHDIMATLKYEIWESVPQIHLSELPSYSEMEKNFWNMRFAQWTQPREKVFGWVFKPKSIVSFSEAFDHLSNIQPSRDNAFLFSKRNHN